MTCLTQDGRESITVHKYGYSYFLVKAEPRKGGFRTPCFMGREGFALYKCRKMSTYKINQLKLNQ